MSLEWYALRMILFITLKTFWVVSEVLYIKVSSTIEDIHNSCMLDKNENFNVIFPIIASGNIMLHHQSTS